MYTVRSIGVMSLAKMMGAVYCALGLIFMPIFLIAGLAGMMAGGREGAFGAVGGVFLAICFPVLYGVIGFVAGAIGALLYNLFARWVGGIELELRAPAVAPTVVAPSAIG